MAPRLGQSQDKTAKSVPATIPSKAKSKVLEKMRGSPRGDWNIFDIEKVRNDLGLTVSPPSHGSHFKVSSPHLAGILPVPARRPIKPPYIKSFVGLCDAHMMKISKEESRD